MTTLIFGTGMASLAGVTFVSVELWVVALAGDVAVLFGASEGVFSSVGTAEVVLVSVSPEPNFFIFSSHQTSHCETPLSTNRNRI